MRRGVQEGKQSIRRYQAPKREELLHLDFVHALRGSELHEGMPGRRHLEGRPWDREGESGRVHRMQVLFPGVPVRSAEVQLRFHGQMRLLPRVGGCNRGGSLLRARVQIRRLAIRAFG